VSRFPEVSFMISAAAGAQFPADHGVEIAFAGRSNAGKSTAINAITARHRLARTSKTPGRTRLLNFFSLGADRRIVDLPGYGFAEGPARSGQAGHRSSTPCGPATVSKGCFWSWIAGAAFPTVTWN